MSDLDYVITGSRNAQVIDSFTAADGTVYDAVATGSGTGIIKKVTNADGTVTESKRFKNNAANLQREFDRFKDTATAAAEATGVTYDDSNLTVGGSGFLKRDKETTLDLVDGQGNVVGTLGGRIGSDSVEAEHARTLANEIIGINKAT